MLVPKMDPHYLWIPIIGLVLLDVVGVIGVAYGAFPPMPVWAVYILSTMIYVLKYFVWLYTPLYVMQDKNLTSRYLEFQQQSLFLFVNMPYLLIDILCFVLFQGSILDKCISVYEEVYAKTSCTFEINA
ncbi:hypothetical protein FRACYDRAFT_233826 [Fragilariopsis cylindrus CCMP1102]|uniref:Transmembrane protein 138 n=1 Tax=Fragilariopsis cylindrus CCMP1102 TaxID=635003 RepID=A0A1E7FZW3_9STRA|nr:hypothetical protein FRACYDRAFT_233826 [Fragilariopsis cylindrus CCMP1102]|eukprot:OEU23654.1 hypothetical protein FRACYDRAFT_233826 [Fragilariopsis cylindrus CCMP1102]